MIDKNYEAVIGLEVHIQLNTKSKLFSRAPTTFGAAPNTCVSFIDAALPGVLPSLNKKAVQFAIQLAKAVNADLQKTSSFARKNYFYPDLPKGYQITQDKNPIMRGGFLEIETPNHEKKKIRLERAHLEEDAAKSLHGILGTKTGIDLNRAGVPLLEIVSKPDMQSPEEAISYLKALHNLVKTLNICTGNMQEGAFRADVNISVKKITEETFGTRVEIKNMNSFKFIEKALYFEANRQITELKNGGEIHQETRLYDSQKNETRSMRAKENLHDYRYFEEPDLLPLVLTDDFIDEALKDLPELPWEKVKRFMDTYHLTESEANLLSLNNDIANFLDRIYQKSTKIKPKTAFNWLFGDVSAKLNEEEISLSESPLKLDEFINLLEKMETGVISSKIAKDIFQIMWNEKKSIDEIIKERNLVQISDDATLLTIIRETIAQNPNQYHEYKNGKVKLLGFFVGQTMKKSGGKANPELLNKLLKEELDK